MADTSLSQASILIVDDDQQSLHALRELLQSFGQSVVAVNSGEDALRCVLKQDFAVVLLDARMPGLDGFETARLIRERERSRHTPIIFLTGVYEDVHSVFRGYEAGAVDYIVKPLVPEILKSKISVFVELHNKNAALVREIAERKRAEDHLRKSEENLRALAAHLQSVREEEWTRISREIHDELGQALTGLKMDLKWVADRLPGDEPALAERTKSMFGLIDETVASVRRMASRLRPELLDQLGLAAAVEWHAGEFRRRTGIRCNLSLPPEAPTVDRERSTAAFRIFQELLTNVARHANATRIDIAMRTNSGALVLTVEDNGKGIEESAVLDAKSLGLLGMRERVLPFGGTVDINRVGGGGTKGVVSIPLGLK
jgi:signal transduction histidine kinase